MATAATVLLFLNGLAGMWPLKQGPDTRLLPVVAPSALLGLLIWSQKLANAGVLPERSVLYLSI